MNEVVPIPPLVLASQSPRRAQLLHMLGLQFDTVPADIDETWRAGEDPFDHAERLAREKAAAVAARRPGAVVIGSDTVVVVDGDVLGKPRDHDDAVAMLLRLQGRAHVVATGVAVMSDNVLHSAVERVDVRFRPANVRTATQYALTGEPLDKAGAYGIQGRGAVLVEGITGDYFAVMGLPLFRLVQLLERAGLSYEFGSLSRVEGTR